MNPEKSIRFQKKNIYIYIYIYRAAQLSKIDNNWVSNQHIRMISEGSCDTEDWSNDAENSALHHRKKLHFKIY